MTIETLDLLAESIFLETCSDCKDWSEAALSALLLDTKNCNPALAFSGQEFTYIDIGSVSNLSKAIIAPQSIKSSEAPSRARQLILKGDVLVSTVRPNLNCVALVDREYINSVASTGFCILRSDPEKMPPEFLFSIVKSKSFIAALVKSSTGASYPAVTDKIIKSYKLMLPPMQVQKKFANKMKEINNQKNRLLAYKDVTITFISSLQSHAFSGNL